MPEVWVVIAGTVLYASRPTRAEAEAVRDEQYDLAKRFGLPVVVEHRVADIRPARSLSS
jgi:hypothetical protein